MPGVRKNSDPFGFGSFPEPSPDIADFQPDPDAIPTPGRVKDFRFNRDPSEEAKSNARRADLRNASVNGGAFNSSAANQRTLVANAQAKAKGWPAPQHRGYGPLPQSSTFPASSPASTSPPAPAPRESTATPITSPATPPSHGANAVPISPSTHPPARVQTPLSPTSRVFIPPHLRGKVSNPTKPTTPAVAPQLPAAALPTPPENGVPPPTVLTPRARTGYYEEDWHDNGARATVADVYEADEDFARRLLAQDFIDRSAEEAVQLQEQLLKQCEEQQQINQRRAQETKAVPAQVEAKAYADADAEGVYERYKKYRELLWMADDLGVDEDQLASMDSLVSATSEFFDDFYTQLCAAHEKNWQHRYNKAKEVRANEEDMEIAKERRATIQEMMSWGSNELDRHYEKVSSAYQQYLEATQGGQRLAAFRAEEKEKFQGKKSKFVLSAEDCYDSDDDGESDYDARSDDETGDNNATYRDFGAV